MLCLFTDKTEEKEKKKGHSDFRSSLLFQVSRVYIKKERKRGKERDRDRQRIKIVDILVLSVESMMNLADSSLHSSLYIAGLVALCLQIYFGNVAVVGVCHVTII